MAFLRKLLNYGLGWQKDVDGSPLEGEAPGATGIFVMVPVESPPKCDLGFNIQAADKCHGFPYLLDGVGLDMGRTGDSPYSPKVTGIDHNFNLDILKRLFISMGNNVGTSLGAGSTGTCWQINCPTSPFSYRFNAAATASKTLMFVEDRGASTTGRWFGMAMPTSIRLEFPADGSPVKMKTDLICGNSAAGATTSGMSFVPTMTAYHADISPGILTMSYGSYTPHAGVDLTLDFKMVVEDQRNAYRNPQDLNAVRWTAEARVADIDHESGLFDDWEAGTTRAVSVSYVWDATPANNGPVNWKINLPAMRLLSKPDLTGDGRLYTAATLEAVYDGSNPLWSFYYNDSWSTW